MNQQELLTRVKQQFNNEWLTVNAFPQFEDHYNHVNNTDLYLKTQQTYEEFIALESLLPDDAKQEYYYMNGNDIAISFICKRADIKFRILLYCSEPIRVINEYLQVNCEITEKSYASKEIICLKGA